MYLGRGIITGILGIFGDATNDDDELSEMLTGIILKEKMGIERQRGPGFELARVDLGIYQTSGFAWNEERNVCVAVYGRIYRDEIKDIEIADDQQYCLSRYKEEGIGFISGLNGNFLLVVQDSESKTTYVANDRFGFRPHYYSVVGGSLYLAPGPNAIVKILPAAEIAIESVVEFFARGEFWGERTWYDEIKIIEPASILKFEAGALQKWRYWEMNYQAERDLSKKETLERLTDVFRKAVVSRFTPGLRIGTSLSGGMDSRTVIAAMDLEKRSELASITFGPSDCGEVQIARKVAKRAGIGRHVVKAVTPELILENAVEDVNATESRLFMGLAFVHPMFSELSRDVDVLMDGFAMDLILGGGYLSRKVLNRSSIESLKEKARGRRLFTDEELLLLLRDHDINEHLNWLHGTIDALFSELSSEEPANVWDEFIVKTRVTWSNIGDVPLLQYLEVTHPSADNRFIDLVMKIPPEKRINHAIYKSFLLVLDKDLAKIKYFNTGLKITAPLALWKLNRIRFFLASKVNDGLNRASLGRIDVPLRKSYVDYDRWFRTDPQWRSFFEGVLLNADDGSAEYLNHDYIRKLLSDQYRGRNNARKLMHIATFKLFMKTVQRPS